MSNTHNAIIYNGEEYGGGSGGHGIIDAEGNEMPYEKDLQFGTGFDVIDDSENGKTIVELDANAADVSFDNTGTDLESTNAEDAIKEVDGKVEELSSKTVFDFSSTYNSDYIASSDPEPICVVCKKHEVKELKLSFSLKNGVSVPVNGVLFTIGEDCIPDVITGSMKYVYFQIGAGTSEKIFPITINSAGKVCSAKAISPSSDSHRYNQGTFVYM